MNTKTTLNKTVYTRITGADFAVLNMVADQRQQTISQVIRKALIDQGIIRN